MILPSWFALLLILQVFAYDFFASRDYSNLGAWFFQYPLKPKTSLPNSAPQAHARRTLEILQSCSSAVEGGDAVFSACGLGRGSRRARPPLQGCQWSQRCASCGRTCHAPQTNETDPVPGTHTPLLENRLCCKNRTLHLTNSALIDD